MADNISTKVLTIDTGGAITNIKDFKERIEELKGALLGLEKGTDEYNSVANELRSSQEKLTEVMDVAKGKAEGIEGSYDNLVAKMRDLKKEWRATADEAERASLGAQILDINNQLKELDASTGNFQRNVGDYANAFEEAFKNVFQGLGESNTALANSSKTIVKLIPLIKKAVTTATVGLQGIQKAIIATGIGALVVAVGLLAANWDKVTEAVRESIPALKKAYDAEKDIEKVSENIKRIKEQSKESADYEVRMARAKKASEKEILGIQIRQQKVLLNKLKTETAIALNAWKELEAEREKGFLYKLSEKALGIYEAHIDKAIQKAVEAYNLALAAEKEARQDLDVYTTTAEYQDKDNNPSGGSKIESPEDIKKQAQALIKALEDANKNEKQLAQQKYQENLAILKQYFENEKAEYDKQLKKNLITKEQYQEKMQQLTEEYEKGVAAAAAIAAEPDKKQIKAIKDRLEIEEEAVMDEKELLKKRLEQEEQNYDKEFALFEEYGEDTTELTKRHIAKREQLIDEAAEKERRKLVEETKKTIDEAKREANNEVIAIKLRFELEEEKSKSSAGQSKWANFWGGENAAFHPKKIAAGFDAVSDYLSKIYNQQKGVLEGERDRLQNLMSSLDSKSEEFINAKQRVADIGMELDNLETENHIQNIQLQNKKEEELQKARRERMAIYTEGLSSVGNLISSISSLMEEQINAEVENKEIGEATAKQRFESVKKMQYAATVINMAAGVVSAIAQAQQLGPVVGPIMAAINSAAVIAAGAVELSQIKRTKYGSNASIDTSTPNLQRAAGNMVEITPVQNITGQNETTELANAISSRPVVVKVTDIDDVNQIKDSTIAESTF